ncbi:hypothetical protein GGF44_002284 [Coemansia sp. RSA 1694]|nr:hypothetical protein GGF44_002284 [Coemansia sp. RSA 1694]
MADDISIPLRVFNSAASDDDNDNDNDDEETANSVQSSPALSLSSSSSSSSRNRSISTAARMPSSAGGGALTPRRARSQTAASAATTTSGGASTSARAPPKRKRLLHPQQQQRQYSSDDGGGGNNNGSSHDSDGDGDSDDIATTADPRAPPANPLARLWRSAARGYAPVDVEAGLGRRRGAAGEPLWSVRMLLLPAMLLLAVGALAGVVAATAWLREWRGGAHNVDIDSGLFPSHVAGRLAAGQYALRLIHTNDVHARFHPHDAAGDDCSPLASGSSAPCLGGAAYVKAVIDHLRGGSGVVNSLLINAGDEFQGSIFHTLFAGNVSAQLLNAYAYDAVTLGNHEFDHGPELLAQYLAKVHAPALCANLHFSADVPALQTAIQPFAVIDRHKVGIIGLLTPETMASSRMGPSITVTDATAAVNRVRAKLNKMGVHRVIVLSHMGYDYDKQMAAQAESGISLIVGGHTHSYLGNSSSDNGFGGDNDKPKGPYPTWVTNGADREWQTAIVQAKSYGEYVGFLDAVFNDDGSLDSQLTQGHAVLVDVSSANSTLRGMQPSRQILELLRPYEEQAEKVTEEAIGTVTAEFPAPEGRQDPRELALGNLVADALAWGGGKGGNTTGIALVGTGTLRRRLPPGPLKRGDLMRTMPFDDALGRIILSGNVIRDIVRAAAIASNSNSNKEEVAAFSTLQVSGLQYTNATADIKVRTTAGDNGRPVVGAVWEDLDDSRKYEVLAPMFILGGGDQLVPLKIANSVTPVIVAQSCRGVVEMYVNHFSPIAPILDHRKVNTK